MHHLTLSDEPAHNVQVLQPAPGAPKPVRNNHATLFALQTPHLAQTLSRGAYSICFVLEVATAFIKSLIQSALWNFLPETWQEVPRSHPVLASSPTHNVQLFARKQPPMRTFTSFNYWMKRILQQRPLLPIFDTSTVCPSTDISDKCVEEKLRLAFEHTKITISASPRAVLLNN